MVDRALSKEIAVVFEENIRLQREQPYIEYDIIIETPTEEFDVYTHWYFFKHKGERLLTNRPSLGIGFKFTVDEEVRFKALGFYKEFEIDDTDPDKIGYWIDCGADVNMAANMVEQIITNVYRLNHLPKFKNKVVFKRDKKSITNYLKTHLPMMFCFDLPYNTDMGNLQKHFIRINKRLTKYNFGKVEFSPEERCVKGYYHPNEVSEGLFAEIKHAGQMGDCEAELIALLSQCYESFKCYNHKES